MSIRDRVENLPAPSGGAGVLMSIWTFPDRVANWLSESQVTSYVYLAFAFVFFYFGLQKPLPVISPVRTPISIYITELSGILSSLLGTEVVITTSLAIYFIGAYEMFLGLLFLFRQIRLAFFFYVPHQIFGFLSLVLIWDSVFQPPWLTVAGTEIPYILGGFSAFVLKNVIFVGAFAFLLKRELGDEPTDTGTESGEAA